MAGAEVRGPRSVREACPASPANIGLPSATHPRFTTNPYSSINPSPAPPPAPAQTARTLTRVSWSNSRPAGEDVAGEVRRLKEQPGKDIIILASSDLAVTLAAEGLIDEYRIMVNPVLVGQGKPVFAGLARDVSLTLLGARTFGNGNVLLTYVPASAA